MVEDVTNLGAGNNLNLVGGFLRGVTMFSVLKWFFVAGLLMYTIFAIVVVKQVGVMSESVESDANPVVKAFAWLHLIVAITLVACAIMFL